MKGPPMSEISRLHISGLPSNCSSKDLNEKLSAFGTVLESTIVSDIYGNCRGFGYVSMEITEQQLAKCKSVYNGAKWRNDKQMKIEKAKESYTQRNVQAAAREHEREVKRANKNYGLYRHATDMSLVNDENVDEKRGWKRGRYGRAIAIVTVKTPSKKVITVDPGHYKNGLEKLFGSVNPKSIKDLCWQYDLEDLHENNEENIILDKQETSLEEETKLAEFGQPATVIGQTQTLVSKKKATKVEPVFINLMLNED